MIIKKLINNYQEVATCARIIITYCRGLIINNYYQEIKYY